MRLLEFIKTHSLKIDIGASISALLLAIFVDFRFIILWGAIILIDAFYDIYQVVRIAWNETNPQTHITGRRGRGFMLIWFLLISLSVLFAQSNNMLEFDSVISTLAILVIGLLVTSTFSALSLVGIVQITQSLSETRHD